jgi:uncharacterized protein YifN (PemK superfamily)
MEPKITKNSSALKASQPIRFVILSTQRSGSTFLVFSLASHSKIECYSELFQKLDPKLIDRQDAPKHYRFAYETYRTSSLTRKLAHKHLRKWLIYRYLDRLPVANNKTVEAIGFKLMYNQATLFPEVVQWIKANNIKCINLFRRNHLKTIVSLEIAKKRSNFSSRQKLESVKVSLDCTSLIKRILELEQQIDRYRQIDKTNPYLELTYEAFVGAKEETNKQILEFLEIPIYEPLNDEGFSKINSDSLEELIENYQEVCQILKGTKFEDLLS